MSNNKQNKALTEDDKRVITISYEARGFKVTFNDNEVILTKSGKTTKILNSIIRQTFKGIKSK